MALVKFLLTRPPGGEYAQHFRAAGAFPTAISIGLDHRAADSYIVAVDAPWLTLLGLKHGGRQGTLAAESWKQNQILCTLSK